MIDVCIHAPVWMMAAPMALPLVFAVMVLVVGPRLGWWAL
jgi:hypothetical protein